MTFEDEVEALRRQDSRDTAGLAAQAQLNASEFLEYVRARVRPYRLHISMYDEKERLYVTDLGLLGWEALPIRIGVVRDQGLTFLASGQLVYSSGSFCTNEGRGIFVKSNPPPPADIELLAEARRELVEQAVRLYSLEQAVRPAGQS